MRSPLAAFAAVALLLAPIPAYAGAAETSFLNRLAGSWSGGGRLNGDQSGPISCKLQFKANGARMNYTGRCSVEDLGAQSFSGSLSYNDKARRYEARSLANTVVGVKRGSSLIFTTKVSSIAGSSYSTMTIAPSRITIDFTILRAGQKITSHVTFTK